MIPGFPKFTKLAADQKEAIEGYTRIFPPYSDYTFPSLWSWNIHEQIELSDLNGNLVVRFTDYVTNDKFLSFLGNKEINSTLEALFALIGRAPDHLSYLKLVPEHNLHGVQLRNGYEVIEDPDNHDYVYSVEELAAFAGQKHQKRRQAVNQFSRNYSPQFVEMNLENEQTRRELENLGRLWIERQVEKGNDIANNLTALRRLFKAAAVLDLFTVGIYVDDNLEGFSVNEFNHSSYVTCLFEQTDTSRAGICATLRNQVAMQLKTRGFKWWNMQQDLGIPGLRTSKKRYHPAHFLKKLIIRQPRKTRGDA